MGFGVEGEITKIYNNYVKTHPECNILSPDAIWLRMKEEGKITQEQYNAIKKGLIFDYKSQQADNDDWKSLLGYNPKSQTTKNTTKKTPKNIDNNMDKSKNYIEIKMNHIFQIDKYGYTRINAENAQDLIKALNIDNITKFLNNYTEKHNNISFTEYLISKGYDTQNKDKEKLLNHIEKLLYEKSLYNPHKKVTNSQVKNMNFTSKNIYDVQYNGKKATIINKTTGKKSTLDFDKLLSNIKDPSEKITHMENMQNLPAEILELYANEGVTLRGNKELGKVNKLQVKKNKNTADGFYKYDNETITLASNAETSTYIHEIFHAVDHNSWGITESETKKFKEAFELGLKRYEDLGYTRYNDSVNENSVENASYYFSKNASECWSEVGAMLYNMENRVPTMFGGFMTANNKFGYEAILKTCWPEFIELEMQKIAEIQSKPPEERY